MLNRSRLMADRGNYEFIDKNTKPYVIHHTVMSYLLIFLVHTHWNATSVTIKYLNWEQEFGGIEISGICLFSYKNHILKH